MNVPFISRSNSFSRSLSCIYLHLAAYHLNNMAYPPRSWFIAACWNASKAISRLSPSQLERKRERAWERKREREREFVKWHRLFLSWDMQIVLVPLSLSRATLCATLPAITPVSVALYLLLQPFFFPFLARVNPLSYKLERLSRDLRLEKIRDPTLSCGRNSREDRRERERGCRQRERPF